MDIIWKLTYGKSNGFQDGGYHCQCTSSIKQIGQYCSGQDVDHLKCFNRKLAEFQLTYLEFQFETVTKVDTLENGVCSIIICEKYVICLVNLW